MTEVSKQPADAASGVDDALADALAQSTFVVVALLNRLGAEHDLSLTQLRVLGILRDRGRVRVTGLATHLGLEKSTLTGLVDRGERRGLLVRTPSPGDGRAVDVGLTEAGQALADHLHGAFAKNIAGLTGALNPAERRRLTALTRRLLDGASPGTP